jgi:DNA replication protein DnaC
MLGRLSRIDVLVIDDWAMAPLSEPERRDFWEICEDRYQRGRAAGIVPVIPAQSVRTGRHSQVATSGDDW